MGASFELVRALLRECLEYPGQSFTTIAEAVGCKNRSIAQSWMNGRATPKRHQDWSRIQDRVRRHLAMLQRTGTNLEHCDTNWRDQLLAHLRTHALTPEAFAESVGTSGWHGRRWAKFGEIPHDAARPKIERKIDFDFTASVYRRSVAVARQRYGKPLPASFGAIERAVADHPADPAVMHRAIHDLVVELRKRGGVTTTQLATAASSPKGCAQSFTSSSAAQMSYGAGAVAAFLVGLARYADALDARHVSSDDDSVARALDLLRKRPAPSSGAPGQRMHVRWDRIERVLRDGTHRGLRYRCPNGESAAIMLIRFCIAYEQSSLTTSEAVRASGIPSNRLGRWLNGLSLPDTAMLPELQAAVERFEGHGDAAPSVLATESPAEPAAALAAAAPPEPATPVPTDGASDILVGMASTARGLRAMHRAGWRPDGTSREHLIAVAQTAMEVGGLTPDDLQPKSPAAAPAGRSPAVAAFREIVPNLRSRSRRGGGTRRP